MAVPLVRVKDILEGHHTGKPVTVQGWVYRKRTSKEVVFLLIRDATGVIQCIIKQDSPAWTGPNTGHRRTYNTLKKIASHYDVCSGLYLAGVDTKNVSAFSQLDIDIYVLGPSVNDPLPPPSALWDLGERALGIGLGLPLDDIGKAREIVDEGRRLHRERDGPAFFLTSVGPVTREVDLESLRAFAEEIQRL